MKLDEAVAAITPLLQAAQAVLAEDLGAQSYSNWAKRRHGAVVAFTTMANAVGAKIKGSAFGEASFALAGVRSVSTQGVIGAACNWRSAAQLRIDWEGNGHGQG